MTTPGAPLTRRQFLLGTAATVSLFSILPGRVMGAVRQIAANDKINVAAIGVGQRGGADVEVMAREGCNIVALCDVDENHAAGKAKKHPGARVFKDYRELLDRMDKEIDAVVVGTPDHTHAMITLEAMRHGKHVYCEKPLTHTIEEARAVMEAARKHKVVTQLGNQGHSDGAIRRTCEWVAAGAIGDVHTVHATCDAFRNVYCQMRNLDKLDQAYEVPKGLDYDLWVGPVPFRPYTPFWVHWNWRGWMPFGTGSIGDWFCHVADPSFWALDLDAPTSVLAEVTDYDPAKHGLTYPPAARITYQFPARGKRGPVKLVWHDGTNKPSKPPEFEEDDKLPGIGAVLVGTKGYLMHGSHGAGGCRLLPESVMEAHSGKNAPPETIRRVKNHAWDWLEAIRTGRQAGSNFEYGGTLTQTGLLGAIAIRFPGQTLEWDDKKMLFTNNKEANAYVRQEYRKGWKL